VLSLVHAKDLDDAMRFSKRIHSGIRHRFLLQTAARRDVSATKRQLAISASTLVVAAPMAYFPFSGWKDSFFGDMHGQGRDAIEFYTDKKVVVERWQKNTRASFSGSCFT